MTDIAHIESTLSELDLSGLIAVQARVEELLHQRQAEILQRLEKDAALIGATVRSGNGRGKPKRRRNSKHDAA